MNKLLKQIGQTILPFSVRRYLLRISRWPAIGSIDFGGLKSLRPVSRSWGADRGLPIDRYYIERFLANHSEDIKNNVLEIGDDAYTRQFGGDKVKRSDILHVSEGSPKATLIADLTKADHIHSCHYDCIICAQTIHQIFDFQAVIQTLHRILKPGGVLLATLPGISQIDRDAMNQWGDYWRFTNLSAKLSFQKFFPTENIRISPHGNVFAAIGFLKGIATEELISDELDYLDEDYQVLITVRAVKGHNPK